MKRILLLLCFAFLSLALFAQEKIEYKMKNGQIVYKVTINGESYGIQDSEGNVIVPIENKEVYVLGNLIYCEGLAGAEKKTWALYDHRGRCLYSHKKSGFLFPKLINKRWIFCSYDYFSFGLNKGGKGEYTIYDDNGKCTRKLTILKDDKGFEYLKDAIADTIIIEPGVYTNISCKGDYLFVKYGYKEGVLSLDGKTIIAPKRYGKIVSDGKYKTMGFVAYLSNFGSGTCGYYNKKGRCLFLPNKYTSITKMSNGLYRVKKDGKALIVDSMDNVKISTKYQEILLEKDNNGILYYKTYLGNAVGKMDATGHIILEPNSTTIKKEIKNSSFAYVDVQSPQGLHGIYSMSGRQIIPERYDKITFINKEHKGFFLTKNGYKGFADINGNVIIPCGKYSYVGVDDKNCFLVEESGRMGLCNNIGVLTVNPLYDYIYQSNNSLIAVLGLMSGVINERGEIIVPFEYTSIGKDEKYNTFNVELFNKQGVCDKNGNILIPPIYSNLFPHYFFEAGDDMTTEGPFDFYYIVEDGEKQGLYTPDGKMLFPATLFDNVCIGDGKYVSDFKSDWYIVAYNNDEKDHLFYYDFNGKMLYEESGSSSEFYTHRFYGNKHYMNHEYKKAIDFYKKATSIKRDGLCYLYMGLSHYYLNNLKEAIKDLDNCINISKSDYLTDKASVLKSNFEKTLQGKKKQREQIWLGILGTLLNVGATIIETNNTIRTHNSINSATKAKGKYVRDTSLDYLLDPRYAMMQVQRREWNEYLAMTNGGKTMSFDQWRIMKAQSFAETSKTGDEGYSGDNSSSSASVASSNYGSSSYSGADCYFCYGLGSCKTCEGRGYYYSPFDISKRILCPNCKNHDGRCSHCNGSGKK